MLADAAKPLRTLLANLEKADRNRRLADLHDQLERARSPERRLELYQRILEVQDERRPHWTDRRGIHRQTEHLRLARRRPVLGQRPRGCWAE